MSATELWTGIDGQEQAVTLLRHSASRPVHAYLVTGPRGSAFELGARHLAAALVAPDDADAVRRVLGGFHPDGGESFQRDRLLPRVIPEAHASPTEGERKVIIIHEAERLQGNQAEAANMLLKTIEEPPPRTVVILTTSFPEELLETVRSRCQRIDFSTRSVAAPSPADVRLRVRFTDAVRALDGTGASVERSVGVIDDALRSYLAAIEEAFATEEASVKAEMEGVGYDDRTVQRLVRRLQEQHKRRLRRARRDALVEGINAIELVYRDVLAGPDAPRGDRPVLSAEARSSVRALDACREARESLEHNPNESLLLERLLLHLPEVSAVA
jgi:DNA polymerase-3 subunit delta'